LKLNLIFIVMELLIVLAYPIVYMHGVLRKLSKPEEGISPLILLVRIPAKAGR